MVRLRCEWSLYVILYNYNNYNIAIITVLTMFAHTHTHTHTHTHARVRVGHGKVNSNCFHNSNCFDSSETIAVSMATNVTVRDMCVTQWDDLPLMQYLLHNFTPVTMESVPVSAGFTLA